MKNMGKVIETDYCRRFFGSRSADYLRLSFALVLFHCLSTSISGQKILTGRVVCDGQAVKQAHVFFEPEYRSTVTDDKGYFSLPAPATGNSRIVVFHPEFVGKSVNLKDYKGSDPIRLTRLVYRAASKEITDKITKEYLIEIFEDANVLYAQHEWNIEFEYSGRGYKGQEHAGSLTGKGICQLPPLFREKFGKSQDIKIYFKSNKSGGFALEANQEWASDDYRKSLGKRNFLYSSFYRATLQGKDKDYFNRVSTRADSSANLNGDILVAISYFIDSDIVAIDRPAGRFIINLSAGRILLVEGLSLADETSPFARFAFQGRYSAIRETGLIYRNGYCMPYYARFCGRGEGELLIIKAGNKEIPQYIDHTLIINTFEAGEVPLINKLGYRHIEPHASLLMIK
jgi:hypothetical protein